MKLFDPNSPHNNRLSLEFVWAGNSTYWAGQIKVVDFYLNGKQCYTIEIPEGNETEGVSLPFIKRENFKDSKVDYLTIKNLSTVGKISLNVGIFNKKYGNTLVEQSDGMLEREIRYNREDISIKLTLGPLELTLGRHYKILLTHGMKPTGGGFWQGESLSATLTEAGPCKDLSSPSIANTNQGPK